MVRFNATTLWHSDAAEWAPSTASFAAAVAGTVVASTWWTFVYYWLFASLTEPIAICLHWIVSDFAGIVSVAPLVIGIATLPRRPPAWREVIESIAALAVLGAMSGVIVSLPLGLWETVVPAALVFPILLWLAARWQPVFSAAGAFIVSMSVSLTAIYGLGHFSELGPLDQCQSAADSGGHSGCGIRHNRTRRAVRRAEGKRGAPRERRHDAGR